MKYPLQILIFIFLLASNYSSAQLIHDFKVNDDTALSVFRYKANISTNKNGLSAIVWEEYIKQNIYAQIYDKNFTKINNNFKVNLGIDACSYPGIIITERDKIGIVWCKSGQFYGQLFLKLYNKLGLALTSAIQINDSLNGYYGYPNIGCDSSCRFIVSWSRGGKDIFCQIIDSVGNKVGNNVKVSEENYGWGQPDISVRKDGSFIIVWKDERYPGDNVYMQMYDKNGTPIGVNQKVNDIIITTFKSYSTPKISQDSSGNFTIAFNVYILDDNWNYIKYQRYDKNGIKLGQNKDLPPVPAQMSMTSFDSDEEGNLIFQMNMYDAAYYYIYNVRIDKNNNPIGIYFPVSDEYIYTEKYGEDIKLHNKKIINVWIDSRLGPQPQVFANIRSFINPDSTVGISKISSEIPNEFKLYQNYPNPFNQCTIIKFQCTIKSNVTLKIYDILGKEIVTLVNEKQSPGTYVVNFDGNLFSTGIYFYSLYINNKLLETKKMLLLK